ncbi:putative AT hook motif-containing protein [Quillaja saponaria]|uniref:AT hook motif-containing protein n=1 Tax=Quillaja saponaria TaxID=32244 RepID=A0AAD7KW96_QUISA|nr:putative AT hook motif-containing protein [Quillaja saponaria]
MSQKNNGPRPSPTSEAPAKRKRGRPRKDEGVVHGESAPITPAMRTAPSVPEHDNVVLIPQRRLNDPRVGQAVSCVINGAFDGGYLVKVKLADVDTHLNGVIFLPGHVTPITAENDVAPHIKMIERKEVPFPTINPQTQAHGSIPSSGQTIQQPVELKSQVPTFHDQLLSSELHSGTSVTLPEKEIGISLGGKTEKTSEPWLESHSASVTQLECRKDVKQLEVSHELEAWMKGQGTGVDGARDPKAEPTSDLIDVISGTVNSKEQVIEHQALGSDLVCNELKNSKIELNVTPVSAEPKSMSSKQVGKPVDGLEEKMASTKADISEDAKAKLAIETSSGVQSTYLNGKSAADTEGSDSAPNISQPMAHVGEAVPSESKFVSEGSALVGMSESGICNSSGGTTCVDSDAQDAIPPNQS